MRDELSPDAVRAVARLSRLALSAEEVEPLRRELAAVLGYVERLRELDLSGVEPLTHPAPATNRLFADDPGATLPTETLLRLAPEHVDRFVKVPRVMDDGSGA